MHLCLPAPQFHLLPKSLGRAIPGEWLVTEATRANHPQKTTTRTPRRAPSVFRRISDAREARVPISTVVRIHEPFRSVTMTQKCVPQKWGYCHPRGHAALMVLLTNTIYIIIRKHFPH